MRDFKLYGQMEAGNIFFVPAIALVLATPENLIEMAVITAAIFASASFLYVGARYWLALDKHIKRSDANAMAKALQFADRAEKPFLFLTTIAALAVPVGLFASGWSPAMIAALVLTSLALLEYVNYYHYQLMNFDQLSDFMRLLRTRKLRRAHMARQLANYRKQQRA